MNVFFTIVLSIGDCGIVNPPVWVRRQSDCAAAASAHGSLRLDLFAAFGGRFAARGVAPARGRPLHSGGNNTSCGGGGGVFSGDERDCRNARGGGHFLDTLLQRRRHTAGTLHCRTAVLLLQLFGAFPLLWLAASIRSALCDARRCNFVHLYLIKYDKNFQKAKNSQKIYIGSFLDQQICNIHAILTRCLHKRSPVVL